MSSHREAPALRLGSGFATVSALAALPLPGLADLLDVAPAADTPANQYSNINITDLFVFQKPSDAQKSILIMNVNPMPPKLADSFDPGSIYEFRIDTDGDYIADIALRIIFSTYANGKQYATIRTELFNSALSARLLRS